MSLTATTTTTRARWRGVGHSSSRAALCVALAGACLVSTARAQPPRIRSSGADKKAELRVSPNATATHRLSGRQWDRLREVVVLQNNRRSKAVTATLSRPDRSGRTLTVEVSASAKPGTQFQFAGVGTDRRSVRLPVKVIVSDNRSTATPPAQTQRRGARKPAVRTAAASTDQERLFADFGDGRLRPVDRVEVLDRERYRMQTGRRSAIVDPKEMSKTVRAQLRRSPRAPRPWRVIARRNDGSRTVVRSAQLRKPDQWRLVTENGLVQTESPSQVEFVRDSDNEPLRPVILDDGSIVWISGSGAVDVGSKPVASSGSGSSESDAGPGEPKAFDYFDCDLAAGDHSYRNSYLLAVASDYIYPAALVGNQSVSASQFQAAFEAKLEELGIQSGSFTRLDDPATGVFGMVMSTADCTFVVFRGTETQLPLPGADWVTHVSFLPSSIPAQYNTDAGNIAMHGGWWVSLDQVYGQLKNALQKNQHSGGRKLWLTGHSLGAVMAVTAAYRLKVDGFNVQGVATYGCPRPGNIPFQTAYAERGLTERTHRWVNFRDLVTRIPLWMPPLPLGVPVPRHVGRPHLIHADESVDLDFGGLILETSLAEPVYHHGAYARLIRQNMPDTSHMPPVP